MWNKFMSKKKSSPSSSSGVGDAGSAAASGGLMNDAGDERNVAIAPTGNAPSFLPPPRHSATSTTTSSSALTMTTSTTAAAPTGDGKPQQQRGLLRATITGPPEEDEYGGILESSTRKYTVRRILVSNANVSPPASIADVPPSSDDEFDVGDDNEEEEEEENMMSDEDDNIDDDDDEIVDDHGYDAQISQATQETYEDANMGGVNGYSDEEDNDDRERGRMGFDPSLPTSNNEDEIDDEDEYGRHEGEDEDDEYDNETNIKGNVMVLGTNNNNNNEDFEASLLLGLGASPSAFTTTTGTTGIANTDDDNIDKATALRHIINSETDRLLRDRSSSGIAELPNTDPTTLPSSMTSFLDVLTEEQRRTRHRYIPGVEGFRKLLKSEIKGDLARARRCRKFPPSSGGGPTKKQRNMRSTGEDDDDDDDDDLVEVNDGMDVDEDHGDAVDGDVTAEHDDTPLVDDHNEEDNGDNVSPKVVRGNAGGAGSNMGHGAAFVAPTKQARKAALTGALASLLGGTPFEDAVGSSSSAYAGGSSLTTTHRNEQSRPPPTTVDSITTFHPPRPQESTSAKTRARLRRWETNPSEVETDLTTYRKTVGKTLDELDVARAEHRRIEAVAGLVRGHLTSHLAHYRDEAVAIDDKLMGVTARCVKLEGEVNGRSVSTRGGSSGRGMREVITTLMTLSKEAKNGGVSGTTGTIAEDTPKDWRVLGVGGISVEDNKEATMKVPLSSGWLLVGDEVIVCSTGEEGIVVKIDGPTIDIISEYKTAIEKESDRDSKSDEKNETSTTVVGDAMDIDKSPMKEEDKDATTTEDEDKKKDFTVRPTTISVQLVKSGQVQTYFPAEIEFNSSKMTALSKLSSSALAKRWTSMIETSMSACLDHDFLAMTAYLDAVRAINPDDEDDGTYSPKSVGQYNDDNRSLLPFGSGLLAAPADFMAYPSVIPMDSLIDSLDYTARTVIYGMDETRVIPTMPSSLSDYESCREEMNVLKGKVMQMRNRLLRQKRLRDLNEQSVIAGKHRAKKMERLLLEMQEDLQTLKRRLQTELTDLGIGNGLMPMEGVPDESGAVSASNTGEDPVMVEGSGVDVAVAVGMDQLGGSKEDTLNVGDSLANKMNFDAA